MNHNRFCHQSVVCWHACRTHSKLVMKSIFSTPAKLLRALSLTLDGECGSHTCKVCVARTDKHVVLSLVRFSCFSDNIHNLLMVMLVCCWTVLQVPHTDP